MQGFSIVDWRSRPARRLLAAELRPDGQRAAGRGSVRVDAGGWCQALPTMPGAQRPFSVHTTRPTVRRMSATAKESDRK